MVETAWIDELDVGGVCEAVSGNRLARMRADVEQLLLAAHWADLHNGDALPSTATTFRGMERAVRLGAEGTPKVLEFSVAEFGALQSVGYVSAFNLIRDSLDLRHRHPLLWQAVLRLEVWTWQARQIARQAAAGGLTLEQARWLDDQVTPRLAGLAWSQVLDLVAARIIEADPGEAEARRRAAEMEQFVHTGRCNEFGLKTLVAKAAAGDVIFFVAMCDRIAQILLLRGDTDPVGVRRAKAVGILANPARAFRLLQDCAELGDEPGSGGAVMLFGGQGHGPRSGPVGYPGGDKRLGTGAGGSPVSDDLLDDDPADAMTTGAGLLAFSDEDSAAAASAARAEGVTAGDIIDPTDTDQIAEADLDPEHRSDAPQPRCCPMCRGEGAIAGDPAAFVRPMRVDPKKLLPDATLYIHLSQDSFTRDRRGVARFEGVGPITVEQAADFLRHCHVTVKPVIDLADQPASDAYEVPTRLREAMRLRQPMEVFPFGTNRSRGVDLDHTRPYVSPDDGGPPGQTCVDNLGHMSRFPHRVKTYGRWRVRQPSPGVYLWRSPHGYYWVVDHTGTHPVSAVVGDAAWVQLQRGQAAA